MGKETPTFDKSAKDEGFMAGHGDPPTLVSYLSSLVYLLSVPTCLGVAYVGYTMGYYPYPGMIPAFAGSLLVVIVATFTAMHLLTRRR